MERYVKATRFFDADMVVRITADCPCIDPEIINELIEGMGEQDIYGLAGEFPDGLDCTIYKRSVLEDALKDPKSNKEHVGLGMKGGEYHKFKGLEHHRWTLDEPEDYEFLKIIFDNLGGDFSTNDVLNYLEKNPININSHIIRNEGSQ